MNTTQIGNISEAKILARFVELGYQVLLPFNQGCRYDMVVEREGVFERIQVKTGLLVDDAYITFNTSSLDLSDKSDVQFRSYYGEIDFFAVYCPQNERCYRIAVDDAPGGHCRLRLVAPRNNQHKGVRWADDYRL